MTKISSKCVSCDVCYSPGFFDHELVGLENTHRKIVYFKNPEDYMKGFIDYIKHNVIKKYPNLSLIKIQISVLDTGNIWHRLFVTVTNMINIIQNNKRQRMNKYAFVRVTYDETTVFIGGLDFTNI